MPKLEENASTSNLMYSKATSHYSRSSMKNTKMKINFQNDTINIFGENIPLVTTSGGHNATSLTQAKLAINNLDRQLNSTIILTTSDTYE